MSIPIIGLLEKFTLINGIKVEKWLKYHLKVNDMSLGTRLKQLRIERGWKQAELAEKIGIHQKQISAYERGAYYPSTEILIRIAEVFNVSLDYLAFEKQGKSSKIEVKDRELLRRFEAIDDYSEAERRLAKEILDLVIRQHKFQELATAG